MNKQQLETTKEEDTGFKKEPPFEKIDPTNIFKNDKLNREPQVTFLGDKIASTKGSFTLAINDEWGGGKTVFVKLLKSYLEKKHKIPCKYLNAWETDFAKDPLVPILTESFNENKSVWDKLKSLALSILKIFFSSYIKSKTSGIINLQEIIDNITKSNIITDNYNQAKSILDDLKKALKKHLKCINKDKPMVIFIDELDRCKPPYAIKLLERIKHVFDIEGLVFVLSLDKKNLSESIKSQYGNIDTEGYLKRFFDNQHDLNKPTLDDYCNMLDSHYLDWNIMISNFKNYLDITKYLANLLKLTPRDLQKIFGQMSLFLQKQQSYISYNNNPIHHSFFITALVFFVTLHTAKKDLYLDLIKRRKSEDELLNYFFPENKVGRDPIRYTYVSHIIICIYASPNNIEEHLQSMKKLEKAIKKLPKINIVNNYDKERSLSSALASLDHPGYYQYIEYINENLDPTGTSQSGKYFAKPKKSIAQYSR